MKPWARWVKVGCVAMGLGLGLSVCADLESDSPATHRVSYTLDWASSEALVEDGRITLQTDLGYELVLTQAYAIAYTVLLVECVDEEEPIDVPGMGQWLLELISPRVAWAGHSYGNDNPTALGAAYAEDIVSGEPLAIGEVEVSSGRYCGFFYLVGPADVATTELPDTPNLMGMSLYFEGTYRVPGGEEAQSFVLSTTRAYSLQSELFGPGDYAMADKAFELDGNKEGAEITLTRNLDTLFDGVNFDGMSADQQATQVLKQLIDSADLSVKVTP